MKKLESGGNFLIDKNIVSVVLAFIFILIFGRKKEGKKKKSIFRRFKKNYGFFKGIFCSLGILNTKKEIIKEQKELDFPVKMESAVLFDVNSLE